MKLLKPCTAGMTVLLLLSLPLAVSGVVINEVRIDNTGGDTDEYFELMGSPGESLDGLTYLVIGDGAGDSGTIESVTDLNGRHLENDGLFAAHKDGTIGTCGGYDEEMTLNFENSDNVTHMLVSDFTGSNGDDLDTDDDGILDVEPWSAIEDCVALVKDFASGEHVYCATQVGPDGTFVPGHILLCDGVWRIGAFTPVCTHDSPGEPNAPMCALPVDSQTWGSLKSLYK